MIRSSLAKLLPDLSVYDYSTTCGNGSTKPNISPVAFLVDRCENMYISGWGGWIKPKEDDPTTMPAWLEFQSPLTPLKAHY